MHHHHSRLLKGCITVNLLVENASLSSQFLDGCIVVSVENASLSLSKARDASPSASQWKCITVALYCSRDASPSQLLEDASQFLEACITATLTIPANASLPHLLDYAEHHSSGLLVARRWLTRADRGDEPSLSVFPGMENASLSLSTTRDALPLTSQWKMHYRHSQFPVNASPYLIDYLRWQAAAAR